MVKRNREIDFIKGAAIILMVFCHAIDNSYLPVRHFINLFHMPVFVMAAGYFFSPEKVASFDGLVSFARKKILRLWLPYVLTIGAFVLLHNLFIHIGFYSNDPNFIVLCKARWTSLSEFYTARVVLRSLLRTIFMLHGEQVGGALWFLQMLFWVYLFYSCVDYVLIRLKINPLLAQVFITVVVLIFARHYTIPHSGLVGGMRTFAAYGLFHLGVLIRHYSLEMLRFKSRFQYWLPFVIGGGALLLLMSFEKGCLTSWSYRTVPTFLIASFSGWILLSGTYDICCMRCKWLSSAVAYIGGFTMPIMIFHFVVFKIVNFVAVLFTGAEHCLVASFPCACESGVWPMIYVAAGIWVPIGAALLYSFVLGSMKRVCASMKDED